MKPRSFAAARAALAFAIATSVASLQGCASESTDGALLVGCDFDNAPFASLDPNGKAVGRDVEMMELLAREAGLRLVWAKLPFEELLPAAAEGMVDAVCATVGITDDRAERVLFTNPYFVTRIAVLVRAGEGNPDSLAALAGRRVAASPGTTSELALRTAAPRAVMVLENVDKKKADARLLAGEVDAVVQDGPDADDFASASGGKLRVLDEPLAVERYAIALPLRHGELKSSLDRAIAALVARGEMAKLDARFGLAPAR